MSIMLIEESSNFVTIRTARIDAIAPITITGTRLYAVPTAGAALYDEKCLAVAANNLV